MLKTRIKTVTRVKFRIKTQKNNTHKLLFLIKSFKKLLINILSIRLRKFW